MIFISIKFFLFFFWIVWAEVSQKVDEIVVRHPCNQALPPARLKVCIRFVFCFSQYITPLNKLTCRLNWVRLQLIRFWKQGTVWSDLELVGDRGNCARMITVKSEQLSHLKSSPFLLFFPVSCICKVKLLLPKDECNTIYLLRLPFWQGQPIRQQRYRHIPSNLASLWLRLSMSEPYTPYKREIYIDSSRRVTFPGG